VEIAYAFLADHAAVPPDGKLYVLGGGIDSLSLAQVPGRVGFFVVAGFRFSRADAGSVFEVESRLVDADGGLVIPPNTLRFQTGESIPQEHTVNTVGYMAPMFGDAGSYRVEFWWSGRPLAGIGLTVVQRAPQPPPGAPAP
jgi:hypothetical protein